MSLTRAGRDMIARNIIGLGPVYDNANAFLLVGDSTAVFDDTQTDLQAATNKFRRPMDPTFPTIVGNANTFRATYGPTEANYAWNEWGISNASVAGALLNRVVEYNGTKLAGQTWILQVTITVNIGV